MKKELVNEEMERFEQHVQLRFDRIKKKIDKYLDQLDRTVRANKPVPTPEKDDSES